MTHVLTAALAGAAFMFVMAYAPVLSWLNLLFGFWYFIGGLVAAAIWAARAKRRGVLACVASGALAGGILAVACGGYQAAGVIASSRTWHEAEWIAAYPDRPMTTPELFEFWDGFLGALRADCEQELAELAPGDPVAVDLQQSANQLGKARRKLAKMRDQYESAPSPDHREFLDWLIQGSHELLRGVHDQNPWPVVTPILLLIGLYYGFLVFVATGGGLLGGLLMGSDLAPGEAEDEGEPGEPAGAS